MKGSNKYSPTARTQILRLRRDLDDLFLRAEALDETSELAGDINRYLCVRVSGYLEQSIAYCARSLCSTASWGRAEAFALSYLNRVPNPRADEIIKFVQRFDTGWGEEIKGLFGENEIGQSINSLLGIRNDIAHGKNQGVSRVRALEYYSVADKVVDFLLERFEPVP